MPTNYNNLINIPNIITLLNLVSGFLGVFFAIQNYLGLSFLLILLAASFDAIDGLVARKLHQVSDIGRELDSLADVVTFGAGPAILLLQKSIINPLYLIPSAFYLSCGALRLARFNIYGTKEFFEGLPIPAAAIFASSITVSTPVEIAGWLYFLIGALMISSIPYPSIKVGYGRKAVIASIIIGLLLVLLIGIVPSDVISNTFISLDYFGVFLSFILMYFSLSYALISPIILFKLRGKVFYRNIRLQNVSQ